MDACVRYPRKIDTFSSALFITLTADTDLLKMVPVGILLNFGNYFLHYNSDFENFFQELCFFITE